VMIRPLINAPHGIDFRHDGPQDLERIHIRKRSKAVRALQYLKQLITDALA
jgi:hypothetical protein